MFETDEFRERLNQVVGAAVGTGQVARYQELIVSVLWMMARNNEPILMEAESRRSSYSQRGIPQALESAQELIETACRITRREGRDLLTVNDVVTAYNAKFCSVWPFCR